MLAFSVLAVLVGMYEVAAYGNPLHQPTKPVSGTSLVGPWHQVSGMPNVTMTAEVYTDSIQIAMKTGSTTGIFWLGTFDEDQVPTGKINSLPDQDALANDIFASNETIKTFIYQDGILSFDFSIMGVHSTVRMTRGAK